ncbi:transcription initiation factor IIA subunit 2-like isoform X1 [Tachypleus tridentatus]|uniref:transcription initiation factor IIA subunit 2-like isoform X1 n=1 Tax=Tachypleus tridentatus TaxID=6853 RepID=UPI003FD11AFB
MSYQLYRNTTLGHTLQESLDELIQCGQITPNLALKVLLQFDKAINNALANRVKTRLTFKAGHLKTYRFCDNVWTFVLEDVEFREVQELVRVEKVKIVACDGKAHSDGNVHHNTTRIEAAVYSLSELMITCTFCEEVTHKILAFTYFMLGKFYL